MRQHTNMYFIKNICAVWIIVKAVFVKNLLQSLKQNEFFTTQFVTRPVIGGLLGVQQAGVSPKHRAINEIIRNIIMCVVEGTG